jgi:uncharacterized membrane protein YuzA (DUF378 family)
MRALFYNLLYMMNDNTDRRYCTLHAAAYLLLWIGAANWGLVGLGGLIGANLNIVNLIFGSWPMIEWLIYLSI